MSNPVGPALAGLEDGRLKSAPRSAAQWNRCFASIALAGRQGHIPRREIATGYNWHT